jgi:Uma2 family endonuclease
MSVKAPVQPRTMPKITYEKLVYLPLVEPRYELMDERLYMVPAPTPYHQSVLLRLARVLDDFVTKHHLGQILVAPCDVLFSKTDVLQPDIFFIARQRLSIIAEHNIQGAPDLIIEIASPSTEERDRVLKRQIYARYGVQEYWIADLEARTVEVLRLGPEEPEITGFYSETDILESPLLEGLKVPLGEIFEVRRGG